MSRGWGSNHAWWGGGGGVAMRDCCTGESGPRSREKCKWSGGGACMLLLRSSSLGVMEMAKQSYYNAAIVL